MVNARRPDCPSPCAAPFATTRRLDRCPPGCGLLAGTLLPHWQRARRQGPRRAGGSSWRWPGASASYRSPAPVACEAGPERPSRLAGRGEPPQRRRAASGLERSEPAHRFSSLLPGSLLLAVVPLGHFTWQRQRDTVELPSTTRSMDATGRRRRSQGAAVGLLVVCGRRWRGHYPRSRRRSPRSRSPRSRRGGRPPPSKRSSASPSARGISLPVA
jgi:hypothetical protein